MKSFCGTLFTLILTLSCSKSTSTVKETEEKGTGITVKRAFVSSVPYDGSLAGKSGDSICSELAIAASLSSKWVSLLKTSVGGGISDRFTSNGPWYKMDAKTLVVKNLADLQNFVILSSINITELNIQLNGSYLVWTGAGTGENCTDWSTNLGTSTAVYGYANSSTQNLVNSGSTLTCNNKARIYCFEQ